MPSGESDVSALVADLRERFANLRAAPAGESDSLAPAIGEAPSAEILPDEGALAVVDDLLRIAGRKAGASDSARSTGPPPPSAELDVLQHGLMHLDRGQTVTLGRVEGEGRVAIDIAHLSRSHLLLEMTDDGLYATDLDSTNGTSLRIDGRDQALKPRVRVRLQSGASLVVAPQHVICDVVSVSP